jgi:uncharacterized protein (UPF0262 family)
MPVHTVRIEESLWSSSSLLRKQDWRTVIHDIVSGTLPWPTREACILIAGIDEQHVQFVLANESRAADTISVPRANVAPLVKEYTDLIKKLSTGDLVEEQFEPLDMAKRVVHDMGARKLAVALPGVGSNFETNRRLFTLVVSLMVDTTRLGPYPGHRHHRVAHHR